MNNPYRAMKFDVVMVQIPYFSELLSNLQHWCILCCSEGTKICTYNFKIYKISEC